MDRRAEGLPGGRISTRLTGSTCPGRSLRLCTSRMKGATVLATMVLSQLEGALLLARTYRSLEPVRRAQEAVKLLANVQRSRRIKA